jgi:hypothetical protein
MDWLTFTTHMVEAVVSLAWPAVAVVLILLLRPHFGGLAARVESLRLPGGAEAHFFSGDVAAKLPAVTSIAERIKALNPAQALVLAKLMEPNIAHRSDELRARMRQLDPLGKRLSDGAAAQRVLLRWQVSDNRDAVSLNEWTDALDIADRV